MDITLTNIDALRRAFNPRLVAQALDRSIRAAAERVRTQISRDVRQRYNIKAGEIGNAVTLRAVNRDGELSRLLVYTGGRLSLRKFGARPRVVHSGNRKLRGVTVQVLKSEGRKIVKGGFLAKGLNAKDDTPEQIFQRDGDKRKMKKGHYIGQMRQPIRKLTGPSIPTMVANKAILAKINDTATDVLNKEFTRQMNLLMDKTGAT